MGWAATALAAALAPACGDLIAPEETTLPPADLLFLAVQAGAPSVPGTSFWASNARTTVRRLQHADAFNTLFAEVVFPAGGLVALDGAPLGPTDSVWVTVQALGGRYGVTVSPAGLTFAGSARPWVTFSYSRYGDLAVADGWYTSRAAYADALRLWAARSSGLWERIGASGGGGTDVVEGPLTGGGTFAAAAPR